MVPSYFGRQEADFFFGPKRDPLPTSDDMLNVRREGVGPKRCLDANLRFYCHWDVIVKLK